MNYIVAIVKRWMTHLAVFLNHITKGKLRPAHITALSVVGHIPVAWALVYCRPVLAAVLLAGFGILDALDGALARVQKSVSLSGMFFDAVTDRIKEIIVFSALAVYVYKHIDPAIVWQVVALCGTSILVSFVKAKGEMAVASNTNETQTLNRKFGIGFAPYEVRVVAIIVSLLFGWVEYMLPLLIAATALTAALRFVIISRELYLIDRKMIQQNNSKKTAKTKAQK